MKKSKIFPVFALSVVALFASCDPAVEYNHVIQNNSNFEVKVLTNDTIVIGKNTSKTLYTCGGLGGVYDYENCCFQYDSIPMLVYIADSIKVIPNIQNLNGWNFHIIKEYKNRGGICECRLILTNEMLTE